MLIGSFPIGKKKGNRIAYYIPLRLINAFIQEILVVS